MCAGFRAGTGNGHQLVIDRTKRSFTLKSAIASAGDTVSYPDDDLMAVLGSTGKWQFAHKDGTPY